MLAIKHQGQTGTVPNRGLDSWPERCREAPVLMESFVVTARCRRGRQIHGSDDPAERWFRIVTGAARKYALKADGRRQIVDFLLPGDFFGFTARDRHAFTVEAVVDGTIVASYPRRRLETLAASDPELGQFIRETAFEAISCQQMRRLLLGPMSARDRVGLFVVEMVERSSHGPLEAADLPMSRYDIADYLALSVETVSRALTDLQHRGAITLAGKHRVRIIDRSLLEQDIHDDCAII